MIDGMTGPEGSRLPAGNLGLLNSGKKFSKIKVYTARLLFFRILEKLFHWLLEVSWNLNREFWLWLNWKQAFLLKIMNRFSELVLFHRFFRLRCMFPEKNPAIKRQSALDVLLLHCRVDFWNKERTRGLFNAYNWSFWNNTSEDLMLKLLCPLSLYVSKPLDQMRENCSRVKELTVLSCSIISAFL